MNLIKDMEDKKTREIKFYEEKAGSANQDIKDMLREIQIKEQTIYELKEELKRQSFDCQKHSSDLQHLT